MGNMKNRFTLIDDWRKVLKRAWSMKFIMLSAVLSAIEFALPWMPDEVIDLIGRGKFAAAAFAVSIAAGYARLVPQPRMRR